MFPFDVFAFPQVWLDWNPALWGVLASILEISFIFISAGGIVILVLNAFSKDPALDMARTGFGMLAVGLALAAFGPWLWVLAAAVIAGYILIYWVIYRLLLRNLWIAVSG